MKDVNQALLHGVEYSNLDAVKNALQAGADVKTKDIMHYAAMALAHEGSDYGLRPDEAIEIFRLLVQKGADINAVHAETGKTPLHVFIKQVDESYLEKEYVIKALKLFQELGANFKAKDKKGNSPLHELEGNIPNYCEAELVKFPFDLNVANAEGVTLAHQLAHRSAEPKELAFMHSHGLNLNVTDINGKTPLHYFAESLFAEEREIDQLLEVLHRGGVDFYARDSNGMTAGDVFKRSGYTEETQEEFKTCLRKIQPPGPNASFLDMLGEKFLITENTRLAQPDIKKYDPPPR